MGITDIKISAHIQFNMCLQPIIRSHILSVILSSVQGWACLASLWRDFQSSTQLSGHGVETICYCTLHCTTHSDLKKKSWTLIIKKQKLKNTDFLSTTHYNICQKYVPTNHPHLIFVSSQMTVMNHSCSSEQLT